MSVATNIAAVHTHIPAGVTLVCVSKFHPASMIEEAYAVGERDFGESHVQELLRKQQTLPSDIRWHMIGHLQTNKVRAIIPFVYLIHSVDSLRLLQVIQREAAMQDRVVNILLEVHVAREETKSGFAPDELQDLLDSGVLHQMPNICVKGIMGMATNTDDPTEIRRCFDTLSAIYRTHPEWDTLSMGMSEDYPQAIAAGSNMVRIGSAIFGERQY